MRKKRDVVHSLPTEHMRYMFEDREESRRKQALMDSKEIHHTMVTKQVEIIKEKLDKISEQNSFGEDASRIVLKFLMETGNDNKYSYVCINELLRIGVIRDSKEQETALRRDVAKFLVNALDDRLKRCKHITLDDLTIDARTLRSLRELKEGQSPRMDVLLSLFAAYCVTFSPDKEYQKLVSLWRTGRPTTDPREQASHPVGGNQEHDAQDGDTYQEAPEPKKEQAQQMVPAKEQRPKKPATPVITNGTEAHARISVLDRAAKEEFLSVVGEMFALCSPTAGALISVFLRHQFVRAVPMSVNNPIKVAVLVGAPAVVAACVLGQLVHDAGSFRSIRSGKRSREHLVAMAAGEIKYAIRDTQRQAREVCVLRGIDSVFDW